MNIDTKWDQIPNYALGEVPEDLIDNNPRLYRLIIIKRALAASYEDLESSTISDLLADVRHLCDHLGLDFAEEDRTAHRWYQSDLDLQPEPEL